MGHTRLGELPRTRQWKQVVGLIAQGAGIEQIANATISAAEKGLNLASADNALVETIYLLTQLPVAARSENFADRLRSVGVDVPDSPSLMDVVGAFSDAIDARHPSGSRSDLGEMAQMAASETIHRIVGERTGGLFATNPDDVRGALASLGTKAQFSTFAQGFFTRLVNRCLEYFLSRAFSYHLGPDKRFATLGQHARFSEALTLHCREASRIVEDFSGGWFSRAGREKRDISRSDVKGFAHVAMRKLVSELQAGAQANA